MKEDTQSENMEDIHSFSMKRSSNDTTAGLAKNIKKSSERLLSPNSKTVYIKENFTGNS